MSPQLTMQDEFSGILSVNQKVPLHTCCARKLGSLTPATR